MSYERIIDELEEDGAVGMLLELRATSRRWLRARKGEYWFGRARRAAMEPSERWTAAVVDHKESDDRVCFLSCQTVIAMEEAGLIDSTPELDRISLRRPFYEMLEELKTVQKLREL